MRQDSSHSSVPALALVRAIVVHVFLHTPLCIDAHACARLYMPMFTFGCAWICPRLPCPSVATVASIRTLIILNTDNVVGERERNRPERDGLQTESEPKVRTFRPGRALLGWTDGGVSGISTQRHKVALTCIRVCRRSHLLHALVYLHSHQLVFEPIRACPDMSVPAVCLCSFASIRSCLHSIALIATRRCLQTHS